MPTIVFASQAKNKRSLFSAFTSYIGDRLSTTRYEKFEFKLGPFTYTSDQDPHRKEIIPCIFSRQKLWLRQPKWKIIGILNIIDVENSKHIAYYKSPEIYDATKINPETHQLNIRLADSEFLTLFRDIVTDYEEETGNSVRITVGADVTIFDIN
jgi:hypothetical protein